MTDAAKKAFAKNKIVLGLSLISIVGIILSFFAFRNSIEQIEVEGFKTILRENTKNKLVGTKDLINEMLEDLNYTAQAVQACDSIWSPEAAMILQIANQVDWFDFTAIVDKDGNGYNQKGGSFNSADKEYFQTAMQGKVAFSEVFLSKEMPGTYVQVFACPVWGENNQVKAVVMGIMNLETLGEVINHKNMEMETQGNLYIIDSNGNYINRFQANESNLKYINFWDDLSDVVLLDRDVSGIKADFANGKEGGFSFCDGEQRRYGCYMPIGISNWQIVYTVKDTAMGEKLDSIYRINTKNAVIAGICHIQLLLCVTWYFVKANREVKKANREVSKKMEMLHMAMQHSRYLVFEYNPKCRELTSQTDFHNTLFADTEQGVTPEDIVEKGVIEAQSVEPFMALFETIKTAPNAKADVQICGNTENMWLRFLLRNIYDEKNALVGTVGFVEDITEHKRLEKQTKYKMDLQNALMAKAIIHARADVETGHLLDENSAETPAMYDAFLQEEIIANVCPEDKAYVLQELSLKNINEKFKQGKDESETQFLMNCGGTVKWVSCVVYRGAIKKNKAILIITDIDKKKCEELELKRKAERDGLTGLYNAATARAKIEEALASGYMSDEQQVLILFDLDNYKQINDTFGHDCGDQVLVEVAEIMTKRFRSSDIVGRMGGDEFVVLLRNMRSCQYAEKLIKELSDRIRRTYTKDGKNVTLSASIGVTRAPNDGYTFADLYKKADEALYYVKEHNKDGYKYYEDLKEL